MLSNQKQNLKSSLHNAILAWLAANEDNLNEAFDTPWGEYIIELMSTAAFNMLIAQENMTRYYEKEKMNFSE